MLDQMETLPNRESVLDDQDDLVSTSARRLFERLNPPTRDPEIPQDADALAIYDWEVAGDTGLDLQAVRTALRLLNGHAIDVGIVNEEHRVVALLDR